MNDLKVRFKMVYAQFRVVGFHQWPDPPQQYAYLGQRHRHEFHVTVAARVDGSNREVEFNELKARAIHTLVGDHSTGTDFGGQSCEQLGEYLGKALRAAYGYNIVFVDVSEDGENGARVIFERTDAYQESNPVG